jgi:hypothetical protein|nr:MAG TPA: hypothetical protein [Caudoviricetes sp.]
MSDGLDQVENAIAAVIAEKHQGRALAGAWIVACEVLPTEGSNDEAALWFLEGRGLIEPSREIDE